MPEGFQTGIYVASETKRDKFYKTTTTTEKPTTNENFWSRLVASTRAPTEPPKWLPISPQTVRPVRVETRVPEPINPRPAVPYGVLPAVVGRTVDRPKSTGDVKIVTMRPPGTIPTRPVPIPSSRSMEVSPVRQLYEHTLKAFCHWLSKIFKSVVFDNCVDGGNKAIK